MMQPGERGIIVLRALAQADELPGPELVRRCEALPLGTVYATVAQLERFDFVESREGKASIGILPRIYKITEPGRRALLLMEMAQT